MEKLASKAAGQVMRYRRDHIVMADLLLKMSKYICIQVNRETSNQKTVETDEINTDYDTDSTEEDDNKIITEIVIF